MTQAHLTAAQAQARLRSLPQRDLYDLCQESHKDLTGVRGRHMVNYSVDQLVGWWLTNYQWDQQGQYWTWHDTVRERLEREEEHWR
jgi:hypothetical protein